MRFSYWLIEFCVIDIFVQSLNLLDDMISPGPMAEEIIRLSWLCNHLNGIYKEKCIADLLMLCSFAWTLLSYAWINGDIKIKIHGLTTFENVYFLM